jgi:hypothetical protein
MLEKGFKDFINVYDPIKVKNYLFRNKGDLQFENVGDKWGFNETSFSNGAAVGDLDNDGDLDLIVNNLDDESFLYENTSSGRNNYLKVKLVGPAGNADGLGSKVTLFYDAKLQYFENKTVRGYLSSNEPIVHFGLGHASKVDSVRVIWNDGKENVINAAPVNQVIQVKYTEAKTKSKIKPGRKLLFDERTSELDMNFFHHENKFNEYKEQVLLPHMFSKNGPFIATGDVNGDDEDDFYIGGAAGQSGGLFVQKGGKFSRMPVAAFEKDKTYEDMGAVLFDVDQDGDVDLYVVSGGSEFKEGSLLYQDRLYRNEGKGNFTAAQLVPTKSSGSCVVPYDVDGDGDLDLFRGGQVVANLYPRSPKSYLLINDHGNFSDQTQSMAPALSEIGMVSSAVWVDLSNDKKAELVVVGEWMPISVFEFQQGKLEKASGQFGASFTEGWWNKIVAHDLDGDGDQDLIAGNLGENYKFKASMERPFQVYAKDFDRNGTNDVFLARYLPDATLVPIRGKQCTSQQMPVIGQKFPTYASFAKSDLHTILGQDMESAIHYKAQLFSSVILRNDNGKLTSKKLPVDAQLSTINGIIVQDFDDDGLKDILIAGNKFDVEVETTPADASPGLFMKGTGNMEFKPLKSFESGFFVPYNVKDIQLIKTKESWTVLVSINDEKLRAFRVNNPTGNN